MENCYCGSEFKYITAISTEKNEEKKKLPNWPSDKASTRYIQQCTSCARLYLDGLILIPWHKFTQGRGNTSCPRCGSNTDIIVDEARHICLNPFCCYCWPDSGNKRPRRTAILHDERTRLIEVLSEVADNPESDEFKTAIERIKKIKEQLENSNKEQL